MDSPLPSLRQTIEQHGLMTKKSLGQHFLLDGNITDKIVRASGAIDDVHVVEIGPGPGGLTRSLLESKALSVTALEKDARCMEVLAPLMARYGERFCLRECDALEVDIPAIVPQPRAMIANLPYNVGTELILRCLTDIYHDAASYKTIVVMLQKEVAERIAAPVNSKAYGRISVLAQWLCHTRLLFELPPQAFWPPPKVTSTVIALTPRREGREMAELVRMEQVTKAAFGNRRKMLRQSLKTLKPDAAAWCAAAGIEETARAEDLSVAQFAALARTL